MEDEEDVVVVVAAAKLKDKSQAAPFSPMLLQLYLLLTNSSRGFPKWSPLDLRTSHGTSGEQQRMIMVPLLWFW